MRRLERMGRIGEEWSKKYCRGRYRECVRYQQEEAGIPHPDTMLPDGSYLEDH